MKKQWLRDQQCEARKRCQEKEAHRAERSHTEKRRGAQRQTMMMMPNQWKTRHKQNHLACDPNVKEQEPIAKGNPSIMIKSVRKTHLIQRVTPSRRNTNETNRLSLRSDRVGEPTTDTRPRQGWPHREGTKETQPTETDGGRNEDGGIKQNHNIGGVSKTGDRQQSTQPQGNHRRMSKPRRT